ncbi:MAG TPA: hypothetical protein VLG25_00720 [Patescibacteria group bacterium]|nr:hypothetical protein [Patescibacteria group bacterium]
MKKSIKKIYDKIHPFLSFIKRYVAMIVILAFLGVYSYLTVHVNSLVQTEPSAAQLDDRVKTISKTKIDQSAVDNLLNLQEQNIEVKSLFDHARENPFNE